MGKFLLMLHFYTLPHKKWRGIMLYSPNRSSVHLSAFYPDSNVSSFWPIFFKFCMDTDIGEKWFGIADGLILCINNRVMALHWCKNVFLLDIFRTNGWILIKFCMHCHIQDPCVSKAYYFWSVFNRVKSVIDVRILFMLNILWINLDFKKKKCVYALIFLSLWYWQDVDLDDWTIFSIHFQQSYGPWLMLKFCLCSTSCGPIDGFWLNFVNALI